MRETSAVWFTKLLWASSSGDRLLVALPYKWDMSQLKSLPAITCTSQMRTYSSRADLAPMFTPRQEFSHKFGRLTTCCLRLDALRLPWQFLLQSETQCELWQSDPTPPWCFLVPNSLVPFLAGVDLCHWRYCPLFPRGAALPVHKINASSQHNLKPEPSPAALCHDSFNFDTRKRKMFPSAPNLLVHRLHWLVWFGASQDFPFHIGWTIWDFMCQFDCHCEENMLSPQSRTPRQWSWLQCPPQSPQVLSYS